MRACLLLRSACLCPLDRCGLASPRGRVCGLCYQVSLLGRDAERCRGAGKAERSALCLFCPPSLGALLSAGGVDVHLSLGTVQELCFRVD